MGRNFDRENSRGGTGADCGILLFRPEKGTRYNVVFIQNVKFIYLFLTFIERKWKLSNGSIAVIRLYI